MSGALPVRVGATAARAIREASDWWRANRPKAPNAFREELERAFELIARQPTIGAPTRNVRMQGVRRILLGRVRYHVYYRVAGPPDRIEVLALWHTSRSSGPPV